MRKILIELIIILAVIEPTGGQEGQDGVFGSGEEGDDHDHDNNHNYGHHNYDYDGRGLNRRLCDGCGGTEESGDRDRDGPSM